MKHISKQNSPISFEDWKSQKGRDAKYKNIPQNIKDELKNSLLTEQNGLCCYCGLSINSQTSHIEHFKPQSQFNKQALNYNNLHASCIGKAYFDSEFEELEFCGHAKSDWYDPSLLVSPLDSNCESYFIYNYNGSVQDNNHTAAKETIEKLHLDKYLLRSQREEAIDGIMSTIDIDDTDDIVDTIRFLESPDEKGNLSSFSFVITQLLKGLI